ncbi:MAG: hypothetical protein WBV46_01995 [Terriglobales bacterium]|jgi:hypothetical protein
MKVAFYEASFDSRAERGAESRGEQTAETWGGSLGFCLFRQRDRFVREKPAGFSKRKGRAERARQPLRKKPSRQNWLLGTRRMTTVARDFFFVCPGILAILAAKFLAMRYDA